MNGGKRGLLVNAENLCRKRRSSAVARFLGHANRGWRLHPRTEGRCASKKKGRAREDARLGGSRVGAALRVERRDSRVGSAPCRGLAAAALASRKRARPGRVAGRELNRPLADRRADRRRLRPGDPPGEQTSTSPTTTTAPSTPTPSRGIYQQHAVLAGGDPPPAVEPINELNAVCGLAVDAAGNLYANEFHQRRARRCRAKKSIDPGRIDRGCRRRRRQRLRRRSNLRGGLRRAGGTRARRRRENRPRQPGRWLTASRSIRKPAASTSPMRATETVKIFDLAGNPATPTGTLDGRPEVASTRWSMPLWLSTKARPKAKGTCSSSMTSNPAPNFPKRRVYEFDAGGAYLDRLQGRTVGPQGWRNAGPIFGEPSGIAVDSEQRRPLRHRRQQRTCERRQVRPLRTVRPAAASSRRRRTGAPRRRWRRARAGAAPVRRPGCSRRRPVASASVVDTAPRRAGQLRRQAHAARAAPPRHGAGRDRRRRQDRRHRRAGPAAAAADLDRDQPQRALHLARACRSAASTRSSPRPPTAPLPPAAARWSAKAASRPTSSCPSSRPSPPRARSSPSTAGQRQAGDPRPHLRHPAGADLDRLALPAQRKATAPTARSSKPRCRRRPATGATSPACG